MPSCAGVGFSDTARSYEAGAQAAAAAIDGLRGARCDLVLLFSTSKHDPAALHGGVRSVVGAAPRLLGGYAVGIITNRELGYDGFQVGVAALSIGDAKLDMFIERGL